MSEGNHENTKKQSIPSIQRNSMQGINLFIKFLVIMETHKKKLQFRPCIFFFYYDFQRIKDVCVTFQSIIKNLKILQIVLLLCLNISVKFEHNSLISLKVI